MHLTRQKIEELVSLIRKTYPEWANFSNPSFMEDEVNYKREAINKAQTLLNKDEFNQMLNERNYREIRERCFTIGKATNLLYLSVPLKGDLGILYKAEFDNGNFFRTIFDLLYGPGNSDVRLNRYMNYIEKKNLPSRWTFPTYLLFLIHPDKEIFIKPTITKWLIKFLEMENEIKFESKPTGEAYANLKEIYQNLKENLKEFGPQDMVDIQSFVYGCATANKSHNPQTEKKEKDNLLSEKSNKILNHAYSILGRKGQVILYGPPGTGKTYWAEKIARELSAKENFNKNYDELSKPEKMIIIGDENTPGLVRICCFHPAYGYEDFIEGYRPVKENGNLFYELNDGIFKQLCKDASSKPTNHYLIIDEINRGDIPRIFGELMTILEKNKREKSIILPLSKSVLKVPQNIYIIGTMNTADRSIALLDTALRRRFGFIEFMPDVSTFKNKTINDISLGTWLSSLNSRICKHMGKDARNYQIGHSYLLEDGQPVSEFSKFAQILQDDIIPLLEEYCYEDYSTLGKILGTKLIDIEQQQIRREFFENGYQGELNRILYSMIIDDKISNGDDSDQNGDSLDSETEV